MLYIFIYVCVRVEVNKEMNPTARRKVEKKQIIQNLVVWISETKPHDFYQ